jgi:twinkle protein
VKSISDTIVEKELPCPLPCGSSDAYFLYGDGHGHCYSCGYHYFPNKEFIDLNDFTYEYLPYRGIDASTFRRYGAKTKINGEGKPTSIGYPHREVGVFKVRSLEEKKFHYIGEVQRGCFGVDKFTAGSHKYVTITEGYEDACSLHQVL